MFWGRLPFMTLSFGYGTKCNNILARNHYNNIVVTTNTSAKSNTVVHDNIYSTKCYNDWSHSGNGAKFGNIVVTVLLLWSLFRKRRQMRFLVVCLSILSVPTQSLKDPQIGNDTIHPELLPTVGVIRWNKVAWVLVTQWQEILSVNN